MAVYGKDETAMGESIKETPELSKVELVRYPEVSTWKLLWGTIAPLGRPVPVFEREARVKFSS